jgi:hypothetical protein
VEARPEPGQEIGDRVGPRAAGDRAADHRLDVVLGEVCPPGEAVGPVLKAAKGRGRFAADQQSTIVSERRKARRAVRLDLNMWATKPDGKSPPEAERQRRTRTSLIQVKDVPALLPGQIFDPAIAASSLAMNSGDQGSPGSGTRLCPARLKYQRGLPRQSI